MLKCAAGPVAAPGILEIEPYVGGQSAIPGVARVIKLSSNETPLGPSPLAIEAYQRAARKLEIYPDGSSAALREAIGMVYGLEPERIVAGAGSDEILQLIAHAYLTPGDEVLCTEHSFLVYRLAALANSARPVFAPERHFTADVDALLARLTPRTKIVFLANPNNPTGTYLPEKEILRLHKALPERVLLVLDAAYAEYVTKADYSAGEALVRNAANIVVTRTFSKIYGLAGLRLGWGYCPPAIADVLNRIRGPFNVSLPAQAAGEAGVHDQAHVARARDHNLTWLPVLAGEFRALGLGVPESAGNFLLIDFSSLGANSAGAADAADRHLKSKGLILRGLRNYGFDNALRLTIGTAEANELVIAAFKEFVSERGRH